MGQAGLPSLDTSLAGEHNSLPPSHVDAEDDVLSHDRLEFVIQTVDTGKRGR